MSSQEMKLNLALKGRSYADIVTIQEQLEAVGISKIKVQGICKCIKQHMSLNLLLGTTLKGK
jgi:hypothetical protein